MWVVQCYRPLHVSRSVLSSTACESFSDIAHCRWIVQCYRPLQVSRSVLSSTAGESFSAIVHCMWVVQCYRLLQVSDSQLSSTVRDAWCSQHGRGRLPVPTGSNGGYGNNLPFSFLLGQTLIFKWLCFQNIHAYYALLTGKPNARVLRALNRQTK